MIAMLSQTDLLSEAVMGAFFMVLPSDPADVRWSGKALGADVVWV